jgi:hypothetical protein
VADNGDSLGYHQLSRLDQAANSADEVAAEVRVAIPKVGRPTDHASQALRSGFATSTALSCLTDDWQRELKAFADQVESLSPRLKKTAAGYRGAEQANLKEINALWHVTG